MPQLTYRGIDNRTILAISGKLVEELSTICECGQDQFTLDCLNVTSVLDGKMAPTYPFIEVAWFDRGQTVRNLFAEALTRHIRSTGIPEVEIAFKVYPEDSYYVNGEPCA
jgi:hypothetical protein